MTTGLLLGQDLAVAAWTWQAFKVTPLLINRAVGLTEDGQLVGSAIFHNYNGCNVELDLYTDGNLRVGLIRYLARQALSDPNVNRVTLHVRRNNKRLIQHLIRFGAKYEATMRCFYGPETTGKHTAVQYALFREQLLPLAGAAYARSKMH